MQPHSNSKQEMYNILYNNYVKSQQLVMSVPARLLFKALEVHEFNERTLKQFKKDNDLA